MSDIRQLVESPIEGILLAEMLRRPIFMAEQGTGEGLFITPQYPVGPYSADFVVTAREYVGPLTVPPKTKSRRIAVECDGYEFHDRTREQAQHDRVRDRYFAAEGLTVLRFTGAEINRDVRACVDEIQDVALSGGEPI